MLDLYARAVVGALPVIGGGSDGTLPDLAPSAQGVEADPAQLAAYNRVCGQSLLGA
jgi:hypothetical protein